MAFTTPDDADPLIRHAMNTYPFRRALVLIKMWADGEQDFLTEDELREDAYNLMNEALGFDTIACSEFFECEPGEHGNHITLTLSLFKQYFKSALLDS